MAILLMPFGMTPAPASQPHHTTMTGMATGHCPDQGSGHQGKGGIAECTMACAAAVPAAIAGSGGPLLITCDPVLPGAMHRLHGLHPDTATPPPKRS